MSHFARLALILLSLIAATARAQSSCPPGDAARTALLPLALQNKLLGHKISADDFELDAPADVSRDIVMLRKTLDVATQAFFHCEAHDDTNPASLQTKLSAFFHTKNSVRDETHDREDGIYGANLTVRVQPAKGFPNAVFVVLTFGIECGDDSLLFLYSHEDNHWRQQLHWYANSYTKPSDAFGDFFLFTAAPGSDPTHPLVAVAHGTPWCTSRFSGFRVALLQPSTPNSPQKLLSDRYAGYSRGDTTPTLKPYPDGVTLRLDASSRDLEGVFTYIGVFRYRTTSGALDRLPVANNARDFVDSWLDESWLVAAEWSESPNATLQAMHERFRYTSAEKDVPTIHYGPILACKMTSNHFEVELDLSHYVERSQTPLPPIYAQVRQNPDSFSMLAITDKPDPPAPAPTS